jgi:hypothetical protein
VFRSAIGGLTFDAFHSSARRSVHDDAATVLQQKRKLVFHAEENAAEIDACDSVPLILSDVSHGGYRLFNTGIVEGEIESAKRLDRFVQRGFHLACLRDIASNRDRRRAELFNQSGRRHGSAA